MSKPIIFYSTLVFSAALFIGSFIYFGKTFAFYKNESYVLGAKDTNYPQMPSNSTTVSQDESDKTKQITYTTNLSKDQIYHFYKQLGILQGWDRLNNQIYTKDNLKIQIKIEKESKGRNLVTVEYK